MKINENGVIREISAEEFATLTAPDAEHEDELNEYNITDELNEENDNG